MEAVSSIVEPFGMPTDTLICPWSISGISSEPASAMLTTEIAQIPNVTASPTQRRVMNSFSTFL